MRVKIRSGYAVIAADHRRYDTRALLLALMRLAPKWKWNGFMKEHEAC